MANILFPRRNDAVVYFEEAIDITETLPWIEAWNASGKPKATLFALLLFATQRALHEHPRMNRFVAGRELFQRDGVWLSFTAKKSMEPGAPLAVIKRRFDLDISLEDFLGDMVGRVREARSDAKSTTDKELDILLRLPRIPLMAVVRLAHLADFFGLLPAAFIKNDPFFASAFLTNLGSVGGGAGYHHLYEYGNIPIFITLGRIADEVVARGGEPVVRKIARVKYSYDERIEDGFNAIRGLTRVRELVEDPAQLTAPPRPLGG
jgi:hypothetical protein